MNDKVQTSWDLLSKPPKDALKTIGAGRLKGMTDVNPQWRYKAMHDVFGPCGIGWKYQIERIWTEQGEGGQVFMFAHVSVYVRSGEGWSDAIPGVGGSMLLQQEKNGLHHNDEAVKMATTDALSVALKMLGVAASIYMGRWDGTKYKDDSEGARAANAIVNSNVKPTAGAFDGMDDDQVKFLTEHAASIRQEMAANRIQGAYKLFYEAHLTQEEQVAVWSLLDSKQRSAIKKFKESLAVAAQA